MGQGNAIIICVYKGFFGPGGCLYDEFDPKSSKQIALVVAEHYGFTEGELDFIINYDIKYRMGR